MLNPGAPVELDLLVVGGLTVDRFAGGHTAAGGSVLHATLAAARGGLRTAAVTVAGDEPEARAGLRELGRHSEVHAERAPTSIVFRHDESRGVRRLVLEAAGSPLDCAARPVRPLAVLYAPVAGELGPGLGGQIYPGAAHGAILQGWLRTLEPGSEVQPLPLQALAEPLVARLAACQLLVASREDLAAESPDLDAQLDALRRRFGPGPTLVVTDGASGARVAPAGGGRFHEPAPYRVAAVPMVGAGDAFAAIMIAELGAGATVERAARAAAGTVAGLLADRGPGTSSRPAYFVGDVHGMRAELLNLLQNESLIDDAERWMGGAAQLWFLGDLVDRGPDGIGVIELVMRLQAQAEEVGGHVGSVLGNHEIGLLAADQLGSAPSSGPGGSFHRDWLANGGRPSDLARLRPAHRAWLRQLPFMARVGPALLVHADADVYTSRGSSVAEVNATVAATLAHGTADAWDALLAALSARRAFLEDATLPATLLATFSGGQVVHGHTLVAAMTGQPPETVRAPLIYSDGRCVAVDAGLAAGGPGFVYRLPPA